VDLRTTSATRSMMVVSTSAICVAVSPIVCGDFIHVSKKNIFIYF
jgi:hypothetical protein